MPPAGDTGFRLPGLPAPPTVGTIVRWPGIGWIDSSPSIARRRPVSGTSPPTREGWPCLARVIDPRTRQVPGYGLYERMPDDLARQALLNAYSASPVGDGCSTPMSLRARRDLVCAQSRHCEERSDGAIQIRNPRLDTPVTFSVFCPLIPVENKMFACWWAGCLESEAGVAAGSAPASMAAFLLSIQ
jgi:hypothetical protein